MTCEPCSTCHHKSPKCLAHGKPRLYYQSMIMIGPHVSISGNISNAPSRAMALGATGFALFTKNQRQWASPPLSDDDAALFSSEMARCGYTPVSILPHAGYLINPASPPGEVREKSLSLFLEEARRTMKLGLGVINIHPGAWKEGGAEEGIKRSAAMLDEVLDRFPGLCIAVENTAGAGTIIGSTFEELLSIMENVRNSDRLGFTLDTAHLYGAGYDVKENPGKVLDSFFSLMGPGRLYGMHLNDSKVPLSSRKDRHESIGKGLIGKDAFLEIVRRRETQSIPLILETPDESLWKDEIMELKNGSL